MSADEQMQSASGEAVDGEVEREFVLMPLFRRMRARLGRRRKEKGLFAAAADPLPSDTIILYPDSFGNYVSAAEFQQDAVQVPEPSATESISTSGESAKNNELPLGVTNLSYFAQHAAAADAQAREAEAAALTATAARGKHAAGSGGRAREFRGADRCQDDIAGGRRTRDHSFGETQHGDVDVGIAFKRALAHIEARIGLWRDRIRCVRSAVSCSGRTTPGIGVAAGE